MKRLNLGQKIFLIIVIASLFRIYISLVTPIWQIPDEIAHYAFVEYFAKNNNIPVMIPAYVEYFQPPVYYVLQGIILKPFLSSSIIMQVHVLRLLSIVFGVLTVFMTYKIAKLLFPKNESLILISTSFVAFLPSFMNMNAGITNDNMSNFMAALIIFMMLKIIYSKTSYKYYAFMGVVCGIALLTRINLIPFVAATIVVFFFKAKEGKKFNIKKFIKICTIVYGIAFIISSWWYFRNFNLYGDFIGFAAMKMSSPQDVLEINKLFFARLYGWAFVTFWATFGITNNYFLTTDNLFSTIGLTIFFIVYGILFLISLYVLVGFIKSIKDYMKKRTKLDKSLKISFLFMIIAFILIAISFTSYNTYDFQPQGRYLFTALPFLGLIFSIGSIRLLKEKRALYFCWVLLLLLNLGYLVRTIMVFIL